jgi:methyltransferase-like protein
MQTRYDELPYPGLAFAETHPDRLATMATLFGMTPAPVEVCRVLELGCGDGANLIPMAFTLPKSCFTGLDLAETAIARGRSLLGALDLRNIRMLHLDLLDVSAGFGEFDYIIAHGLYSWVPPHVRERILEICKLHLAANGVAYISYNTYPGGHLRDALRNMMLFHVRNTAGAEERSRQARELLEFLVASHSEQDMYSAFLRSELESCLGRSPAHFFHDELNEFNQRFYFHEFVRDVSKAGLQYLTEVRLMSTQAGVFSPDAVQKMRGFSEDDDLVREQYFDFLKLRNFRQSLVCHAEVRLNRRLDPSPVRKMSAASLAKPASSEPDVTSTSAEEFRYPTGGNMSTNHPLAKAAMLHLGRIWPAATSFSELLDMARRLAGRDSASAGEPLDDDASWLSDMLLKLFAANFAELRMHQPVFAATVSNRPVASALARAQLQTGHRVTNLRHEAVAIDDDGRTLLSMLDGTRDQNKLLGDLREKSVEVTAPQLESSLRSLARMALLVA